MAKAGGVRSLRDARRQNGPPTTHRLSRRHRAPSLPANTPIAPAAIDQDMQIAAAPVAPVLAWASMVKIAIFGTCTHYPVRTSRVVHNSAAAAALFGRTGSPGKSDSGGRAPKLPIITYVSLILNDSERAGHPADAGSRAATQWRLSAEITICWE